MDKYNPGSKCSKCGYDKIATRHDNILETLIHRRCGRCGYKWTEKALDADA